MVRLATSTVASVLIALPALAQAAPSSAQGATSAALAEGVAVSGVRLQRRQGPGGLSRRQVASAVELDREGNLPALWVGLKIHSSRHEYRFQVDAVRLATSALPAGGTIRAAASGAGAAWDLLRPGSRSSPPQFLTPPALWQAAGPFVWLGPRWPLAHQPARWAPLCGRQADADSFYEFLLDVKVPAPEARRSSDSTAARASASPRG